MRKLLIPVVAMIALISFSISSCTSKPKTDEDRGSLQPDDSFQEVKINGLYSMKLPDYLTEGYDLNDEASLQYQNTKDEVYVIVLDESKEDFVSMYRDILEDYDSTKSAVDNYATKQMESIEENMETVTSKSTIRKSKLNGCDARIVDVIGTQTGIADGMGFTVAFIEGKETLYMLMTWTFEKDKPKFQDDMDKMINSFREL